MIDITKLTNELRRDEDTILTPYYDSLGVLSIGTGRNLERGISEDEADYMLQNDIQNTIKELDNYSWFEGLSPARKRAIINMYFNLGAIKFATFKKMIRAIEISHFDRASIEALDSKWASQVGQRALRIAKIIKTGEEA